MSTQPVNPAQSKEEQRRRWDEAAVGWTNRWETFERSAQHVSDRLIELAQIAPGHRVLDVATGIGEPAARAALRVGPSGSVIATDHSPRMIASARERAAALGISNIDFREMDAEALDFPDGSFDAILSRWGLMFLQDLPGALARMQRLLKPGGHLAAAVWSDASKVPLIGLLEQVRNRLGLPPPPPGTLGPLSLSDIAALERTLRQAGFGDVNHESLTVSFEFSSIDDYLGFVREVNTPFARLAAEQTAEMQARIWSLLAEIACAYTGTDSVVRLPNRCFCVAGRR